MDLPGLSRLTAHGEDKRKHGEEKESDWTKQDNGDKDQSSDLASLSGKDEIRGRGR